MFAAAPAACARRVFVHRPLLRHVAADMVPRALRATLPLLRTAVRQRRCARRLAVPKKGFLARLNTAFTKHSYKYTFVFCLIKGASADVIAQYVWEGRDELNLNRTLGFACFSGIYTGLIQNKLYKDLYPLIFGASRTLRCVFRMTIADVFLHSIWFYMPIGYFCTNLFTGEMDPFDAVRLYFTKDEFIKSAGTCVMVWIPFQMVTFSLQPHVRAMFVGVVSFAWLQIMSSLSYQGESAAAARGEAEPKVPGPAPDSVAAIAVATPAVTSVIVDTIT